jgi:hypothetical protein
MSKLWNDEEYYRRLKQESRRRVRGAATIFCSAMLVIIMILAIIGNPQIILVAILLIAIVLAGVFFALFVSNYNVDWEIKSLNTIPGGRRIPSEEELRGRDPAKSMNVFVRHAALGSEYSRREIALELKHLLVKFGLDDASFVASFPHLKTDFQKVVHDYEDHREINKGRFGLPKRHSHREREAYLDSLQRIIKQIDSI